MIIDCRPPRSANSFSRGPTDDWTERSHLNTSVNSDRVIYGRRIANQLERCHKCNSGILHKSKILFHFVKYPRIVGIWFPQYFSGISSFNSLNHSAAIVVLGPAWARGLVNDNDGFVGVAYIFAPPPMFRRACPKNVCIWCGNIIILTLLTGCVGQD